MWRLSLAGLTESPPPLRTGRITAPTLAIWGDRDPFVTLDDQAALVAGIPGARRETYAGVGHLVLWEQPGRLADDVTAFVEVLEAGPVAARIVVNIPAPLPCSGGARTVLASTGTTLRSP